eukprot:scaffold114294_cov69-Cyclotella_meneghiniana.AAC.5
MKTRDWSLPAWPNNPFPEFGSPSGPTRIVFSALGGAMYSVRSSLSKPASGRGDDVCCIISGCTRFIQHPSGHCNVHEIAIKKGISAEAVMTGKQTVQNEQRALKRHLNNVEMMKMIDDLTNVESVEGFGGYLAKAASLVMGVLDFNTIKLQPFACLVSCSMIDPFNDKWITDDNGHPSLMPYSDLPKNVKGILGHSRYYAEVTRSGGEPTAVYAHANVACASFWYANHWKRELRTYFKDDQSRFTEVDGVTGVVLFMAWFLPYHIQFHDFHQVYWGGKVVESNALLTKCEGGATPSAWSSHFFPHPLGLFRPENLMWSKRDQSKDRFHYLNANPEVTLNIGFDDERLRFDSTGIKTIEYDKAKRVGIPSFQNYFKSKLSVIESKPSAIASAPMLDDNEEVPPEVNLQPRVSAASKERYVSFESTSSSASYETPKSDDVIDLTDDDIVDLTVESPRPNKKSKKP